MSHDFGTSGSTATRLRAALGSITPRLRRLITPTQWRDRSLTTWLAVDPESAKARAAGRRRATYGRFLPESPTDLVGLPGSRQILFFSNCAPSHQHAVLLDLLDRAELMSDPVQRVETLRLGRTLFTSLKTHGLEPDVVASTDACLRAHLGDALRRHGEIQEAEALLAEAEELAAVLVSDPLLYVEILALSSLVDVEAGRWAAALDRLNLAVRIGEHFGARELPELVLRRGEIELRRGEPAAALDHFQLALEIAQDAAVVLAASHGRAEALLRADRPRDAFRAIVVCLGLYEEVGGRWAAVARPWLEGEIEAALGWHEEAAPNLERALAALASDDHPGIYIRLNVSLAASYLALDRLEEAVSLVDRASTRARAQGVPDTARTALEDLREAAEKEHLNSFLFAGVSARLLRCLAIGPYARRNHRTS